MRVIEDLGVAIVVASVFILCAAALVHGFPDGGTITEWMQGVGTAVVACVTLVAYRRWRVQARFSQGLGDLREVRETLLEALEIAKGTRNDDTIYAIYMHMHSFCRLNSFQGHEQEHQDFRSGIDRLSGTRRLLQEERDKCESARRRMLGVLNKEFDDVCREVVGDLDSLARGIGGLLGFFQLATRRPGLIDELHRTDLRCWVGLNQRVGDTIRSDIKSGSVQFENPNDLPYAHSSRQDERREELISMIREMRVDQFLDMRT